MQKRKNEAILFSPQYQTEENRPLTVTVASSSPGRRSESPALRSSAQRVPDFPRRLSSDFDSRGFLRKKAEQQEQQEFSHASAEELQLRLRLSGTTHHIPVTALYLRIVLHLFFIITMYAMF
ncbi:hypothetical protein NDU88_007706 [Pleurodeles waltl]|uniref:Uncharacterized protein n=1 Tax=Pleurodeles waltl TaxID=8319 RepID=A0AAV7NAZ7_PLEWA|nr:hypothetical protein NDU88_007706 [Pleurodeles waltl]